MEEKGLTVKLLGDFSVRYGEKNGFLGRTSSGRIAQFFQILMLDPLHQVSKEKLMADLYKYHEFNNKNNSLNNVIYRLRRLLSDAGIPGEACITVEDGICRWNSQIPVYVDALEFADCLAESSLAEGEEKKRCLRQAWLLYRGDILPGNSMEEWAILEYSHYKQLYRRCIEELAAVLKQEEDYVSLFSVCSKAAAIEPYEGWQTGQLDALLALGEYEKAYQLYEKTVKLHRESESDVLIGEMQKRFREISRHLSGGYEKISEIQRHLIEAEQQSDSKKSVEEQNTGEGAYYCEYLNFAVIYRYVCRIADRLEEPSFLMQCILVNRQGNPMRRTTAQEKERLLTEAIRTSLRKGDVCTRYSVGQLLVILNRAGEKNCSRIFRRIAQAYEKSGGNRRDIESHVVQIMAPEKKN